MTPPLPTLRPLTRGGKGYYDELRTILAEIGPALLADAQAYKAAGSGFTVAMACRLALRYELNLKAVCTYLEDQHVLACGTYDSLLARDLKPLAALRETWTEIANGR